MNYSLFDKIEEFNSPTFLLQKIYSILNQKYEDHSISLDTIKKVMLLAFGKKIKKKILLKLLKNEYNHEFQKYDNCTTNNIIVSIEDLNFLFSYIKNNPNFNHITNHDLVLDFYNYMSNQIDIESSRSVFTLYIFKNKIKERFPNLSNNLIEDIFLLIDKDKDGVIKLSDLENYLL